MPFKEDTLKSIKSSIGLLEVWIDQTHDKGQVENKKTKRYEGALRGVCHAVVNEWLSRSLPYLGHGFAEYFRLGIPDDIRAVQCAMSDRLFKTKKSLMLELSHAKAMSQHAKTLNDQAQEVSLDLRGDRIVDLKKRLKELQMSRLKVFDLDGMTIKVQDKPLKSLKDLWDELADDGYYQVHFNLEADEFGHAIGVFLDRKECQARLLDPNSGLILFPNLTFLSKFFEDFWNQHYKGQFDTITVATYTAQKGVQYGASAKS